MRYCLLVLMMLPGLSRAQEELEPEDLRRGLIATFTDPAGKISVSRLEPTIALHLAVGEAPHPLLGSESGEYRWSGYINIVRGGDYYFEADLRGTFALSIAGKPVFRQTATGDKAELVKVGPVKLEAGIVPIEGTLTRAMGAARLAFRWMPPTLRFEPIPAEYLGHIPKKLPPTFAADSAREAGRYLFEESGCVRCHLSSSAVAKTLYQRQGPSLEKVGARAYGGWLEAWLNDPRKLRPATNMPDLFADDETGRAESHAVALYLTALGGKPLAPNPQPKNANPKDYAASAAKGSKAFVSTGCAACHGEQPKDTKDGSFYGPLHMYPLGAVGSKTDDTHLEEYLNNPHQSSPQGRMPQMNLGEDARNIARYLIATADKAIPETLAVRKEAPAQALLTSAFGDKVGKLAAEPAAKQWLELGKALTASKGCANCHQIGNEFKPATTFPSLADVAKAPAGSGCATPASKAARYGFVPAQTSTVAAFLTAGLEGAGSKASAYDARIGIRRLLCVNCHQRDTEGGLSLELSDEMKKNENAQNADDVRPPLMTGVGHKMRTSWLKTVLVGGGRSRPWMSLKMPQFGEANVGTLHEGLTRIEGAELDDEIRPVKLTPAKIADGRQMIGTKGFGCISCHDIAGIANTGTRGPDLSTISQRLRYDWYRRWLETPLRMAPGTRMPQVFINGKSLLATVLEGHADNQAEAMWAYLSLGPNLPLPEGLQPPKGLIVRVGSEPELLRTFLSGAGNRAIAVGFPGNISVAFDAVTCRLTYAWAGAFLDASPVWDNRGGAPARLLGPKFWTAPAGNPWGLTGSSTPPDFAARAKDPAFDYPAPDQKLFKGEAGVVFDGYSLDKGGYPTFRYRVRGEGSQMLKVSEKPTPLIGTIASGISRGFTAEVPQGLSAWFFAGESTKEPMVLKTSGEAVKFDPTAELPTGDYRIGAHTEGGAGIVFDSVVLPGAVWKFVPRATNGGYMLMVRLPLSAQPATVKFDLKQWTLSKLDAELIQALK